MFGDVRDFCKFKKYIDSRNPNYNEKSTILDRSRVQPKQRDVALRVARLIFLIIFVTSCYVLNKIVILSEISIPEWSETGPGPRGIVVMTRRAYCLSSVRVIRWQGRASWRNRLRGCTALVTQQIIQSIWGSGCAFMIRYGSLCVRVLLFFFETEDWSAPLRGKDCL